MIGPHSSIEELEGQVRLFRNAWGNSGKTGTPALPMIRETFVARSRSEAITKARPCLEQLYRHIYVKWKQNEAMSNPDELHWDFERLAKNRFILGSPQDCVEQIKEYVNRLGTDFILFRFDWTPGLGQKDILDSMELFGREVIPCFKTA
jgi:alkanesulfonate monooxygenase SsuD/methylene tetrahydromethanopterin reductase-like flavin-dependent oxidoreductase (luciferase family)